MQSPPRRRRSGYLPGLDGLRAIAILGVLMTHDLPWTLFGHSNVGWKGLGGGGVNLFFAISGFLISWRLLEDEQKLGRIHLGAFYVRRLFRIQPASWCYLTVVAILFVTGELPVDWHYWFSAFFGYANFLITTKSPLGASAFLGHFWTLAVEEHFYILISLFLLSVRKHRAVSLAILLLVLITVQRSLQSHNHFDPDLSPRRTYWNIQFLLAPALLAVLLRREAIRTWATRYLTPRAAMLFGVVFLGTRTVKHFLLNAAPGAWHQLRITGILVFNMEWLFYGCGLLIVAVILHPQSFTTRALELSPLRFFGRISYSIYLWHLLFFGPVFFIGHGTFPSQLLMALSARPWKYLASFVLAVASYYLLEKPFIRLGHRLAPPATEGHADLTPAHSHETPSAELGSPSAGAAI
jgi:peptidoglycan/LPS O-acetylase OafA/YrhL